MASCADDGGGASLATDGIATEGLPSDGLGSDDEFMDTTGSLDDTSAGDAEDSSGDDSSTEPDPTTGGEMFDCSPAWADPWVGSPCMGDSECDYEGGFCVLPSQGYPCGTCSMACTDLCPDIEQAPETFCVSGAEVGLDPGGYCLSQCDAELLSGDGCRDGYACAGFNRYMNTNASAAVCVPELYAGTSRTECQQILMDLGAVFTPVDHTPDSPEGFPNLECEIDEPVLLHTPVNGVALRYIESDEPSEVFLGCQAAISVVGSAAVAAGLGIDEILHIGTYNCRVIAGTTTISQHGLANAIDIGGFVLDTGVEITVLEDWEDGSPNPSTEYGQILRDFTDQLWALGLWNVIFTPEHNAAHDNHFHVDLLVGGNTYD